MLSADIIPLLRCPTTKQPLRYATATEKEQHHIPANEPALVTHDGSRIYRAESGLPVLLSANDDKFTG